MAKKEFKAKFEKFMESLARKLNVSLPKDLKKGKKGPFAKQILGTYRKLFGSESAKLGIKGFVQEKGGVLKRKKLVGYIEESSNMVKLVEITIEMKTGEMIVYTVYGQIMGIGTESDKIIRAESEAFKESNKDIIKGKVRIQYTAWAMQGIK
jgi:hypothetical protein